MKKKIMVAVLLFASFMIAIPSFAQIRKVPAEVTQALKEKYPNAENVSWQDKLTDFAATFYMSGQKYEARFSDKGEWLNTEKEISESDLPRQVKEGFDKSKYADWQLRNFYLIELPDHVIQYRIHIVKSDIQKKYLLFNSDGQLLKDNLTLK